MSELFEEKEPVELEVAEPEPEEIKEPEEVEEPVVNDIEDIEDIPEPVKEKPKKKKRVLSEAQKERLRENLKRGRETSLANRKKKAMVKKIEKEEKVTIDDQKIFDNLKKKLQPKDIEDENIKLRAELFELRKERENRKKEVAKQPEPEKEKNVAAPEPVKPVKKPPMTARQKLKMLRGL